MTARTAERITGMVVKTVPPESKKLHYALYAEDTPDAKPLHQERASNPGKAVTLLVEWNYSRVRTQVFKEQNYRCWSCWRILPLSCDHVKPRAHGREDLRTNLRGLCAPCHDLHTRNYKITLHPKMAELMSKVGYRWLGEYALGCEQYGWEKIAV